jgi:hypothetical protein
MSRGNMLSMIAPSEWKQRHLATVRLNMDRQWKVESIGEDVKPTELFGTEE